VKKKLILMRGVPNSGKSYQAKMLAPLENILSTDDYFTGSNPGVTKPGGYRDNWVGNKLPAAHAWNQGRCHAAMTFDVPLIVIDNTNLKKEHAAVYARMAREFGYSVEVHESKAPWWLEIREHLKDRHNRVRFLMEWAKKLSEGFSYNGIVMGNGHGVPEETIFAMLMSMEDYTAEDLLPAAKDAKAA
jgi:predicted kinase